MRRTLAWVIVAAALSAPSAFAQYQNRSIGFSVGYWDLQEAQGLDRAFPVGLTASTYFDNAIEGFVNAIGMIVQEPINDRPVFGFSLQIGARYLFMQGETLRPYAGLHASYFHVFFPPPTGDFQYAGVGPHAGIEWFVADALSIGLKGQYNFFLNLTRPLQTSLGLSAELLFWY